MPTPGEQLAGWTLDEPIDVASGLWRASRGGESGVVCIARTDLDATTMASLRHPLLGRTVAQQDGRGGFVVQSVGRASWLVSRLDRSLRPEEVRRIAADLGEVLAWLHGRGVFHNDLRCEVVALQDEGGVVLAGLRPGAVGALSHRPPESRRDAEAGRAVDLYALGVVLFACLIGPVRRPEGSALDPGPGVPPDLRSLVLDLTCAEAELRIASASAVVDRLRGTHHMYEAPQDSAGGEDAPTVFARLSRTEEPTPLGLEEGFDIAGRLDPPSISEVYQKPAEVPRWAPASVPEPEVELRDTGPLRRGTTVWGAGVVLFALVAGWLWWSSAGASEVRIETSADAAWVGQTTLARHAGVFRTADVSGPFSLTLGRGEACASGCGTCCACATFGLDGAGTYRLQAPAAPPGRASLRVEGDSTFVEVLHEGDRLDAKDGHWQVSGPAGLDQVLLLRRGCGDDPVGCVADGTCSSSCLEVEHSVTPRCEAHPPLVVALPTQLTQPAPASPAATRAPTTARAVSRPEPAPTPQPVAASVAEASAAPPLRVEITPEVLRGGLSAGALRAAIMRRAPALKDCGRGAGGRQLVLQGRVRRDGALSDVDLSAGSGAAMLDSCARAVVEGVSVADARSAQFRVTIRYVAGG